MKPKLYLESSIPSYLVARPTRDLVIAGNQALTRQWWSSQLGRFSVFVAQVVLDEVSAGDPVMASQRLELLKPFPQLVITPEAETLAQALVQRGPLPAKAARDALHIALAAVHQMHFLLTWNCRHIANAQMLRQVAVVCERHGCPCPVVCTPAELMYNL